MFMRNDGGRHFPVHHVHMARPSKKKTDELQPTKLRQWREFRDLSLESAADVFGITHGQLSKIERGKSPYNQRLLEKAADLYRCTVIDLLARAPDEAEDLFSNYAALDEEGKRQAARLVGALKVPK